jgi:hypothetical protein
LTKLKKQNNKIGAFHSNTKLFGKKGAHLHACIPRASPYMQPMFHQKKIAAIVPLGLGLELCPSAMAKVQGSWRGGPAEPGHLPRSRQACLKGMVKWYWYLPIRNSLSYFSLTLSLSSLAPSSLHHS